MSKPVATAVVPSVAAGSAATAAAPPTTTTATTTTTTTVPPVASTAAAATTSSASLPKYFTLSSTKPLTLVATATPKSVPSLLKTLGPGVRPPAQPQQVVVTASTAVTPAATSTPAARASSSTTKVINFTSGSGTSQTVRFPMTFNIATSSNGKSGVIPVVLSPSAGARNAGSVSIVRTTTPSTSAGATATTTPSINSTAGAAAAARKKLRLASEASANVTIKQEEGTSASTSSVNGGDAASRRRRRTTEDGVKGLRYFATKVCDKVREKNLTTYNSVAEDLVQEYSDPHPSKSREEIACEQKNIRRRVYDALNVLMAINVIQKERKQIRWVGLPRSLNEAGVPKRENMQERKRSLQQLRQRLFHSSLQLIGLKELAEQNKTRRAAEIAAELETVKHLPFFDTKRAEVTNAAIAADLDTDESQHIHMPFLFITCRDRCEVECSVSTDAKEYELQFSEPFKIIEDTEVLRHTALVRALDKGEYGLDEVKKAVEQLPGFMTNRFIGLLNEHQEKIKKLQDSIKAQETARTAAAAEAQRQQQQLQAMQTVLSGNMPIAPAPIKLEEGVEASASTPSGSGDGGSGGSTAQNGPAFHPVVSVPNCAPIAALHSGSPVTLKPAYYIQISKMGVPQLTSVPATASAPPTV